MYTFDQGKPLAVVGRPKLGVLEHRGVHLPNGLVAHCTPTRGEHLSTFKEFAQGKPVRVVRHVIPAKHAHTLRLVAAALQAPQPYHLTENNCEVFANRVTGEVPESPQLRGIVAALVLVGFIGLMASAR